MDFLSKEPFEKFRCQVIRVGNLRLFVLIRWASLFFLALGLGAGADSRSRAQALAEWEAKHIPSISLVHRILESYGLTKVSKEDLLRKVMRTLPSHLDQNGSFWFHSSPLWVVYFSDDESGLPYHIYSKGCFESKGLAGLLTSWDRIGVGWGAVQELEGRLVQPVPGQSEAAQGTTRPASWPVNWPSNWKDTRALNF